MKIIVCEKCFSIPKITIINSIEVKLECHICKTDILYKFDYFKKFININENDDLFALPNCNKKKHSKTIIYCFQYGKYLCEYCLKIHNDFFGEKKHNTIKQKIKHQYFCTKEGHEENKLKYFCLKCNNYLCSDCRCDHEDNHKYNFSIDENKINEIKNNIKKCEEIIKKEEENFKNLKEKLENKIKILTNLFKDYKKRNDELISLYKLLIDNFEQIKNINNYNIRNNILLNNNFNVKESQLYSDDCFDCKFNKLSEFYRNTNHIKTQEISNYYTTSKYCDLKIKKCLLLNEKVILLMFEKKYNILFIYKNKESITRTMNIFFDDFIANMYPLNNNKFINLFYNNNLSINKIAIDDSLSTSTLLTFENVQYIILDESNKECFFTISNFEKNIFFILKYYINNGNKNINKIYKNRIENKDNMYLILKENKKFDNNLFGNITKIIDNSEINNDEKQNLKLLFAYDNNKVINIQNLINSNNKFLNYINKINDDIFNKIKDKININENKYVINSNYIMKLIININKENLNQNEIKEINYLCNINKLCKKIMEKYIHYLIYNSKINNIYNYKNKLLLFMGEKYLFVPFSLKSKKIFRNRIWKFNKN